MCVCVCVCVVLIVTTRTLKKTITVLIIANVSAFIRRSAEGQARRSFPPAARGLLNGAFVG